MFTQRPEPAARAVRIVRIGGPSTENSRLPVDPVVTSVLPVTRTADAFGLAADPARSCKALLGFTGPTTA